MILDPRRLLPAARWPRCKHPRCGTCGVFVRRANVQVYRDEAAGFFLCTHHPFPEYAPWQRRWWLELRRWRRRLDRRAERRWRSEP